MHSYTDFPPPWSALWDFQQPKDTQQRLLDHLSETVADSTVAYQIEVQTQVARTLGLQMEYAAAHQLLDHIQSELTKGNPRTKIYYLLERGRVYNSAGEKKPAPAFWPAGGPHFAPRGWLVIAQSAAGRPYPPAKRLATAA